VVQLSRGGADAVVVREFDLEAITFVANGFALPEAKSTVAWCDADTLYVGTNDGPGAMTTSGYPRVIKRWTRGTPLALATTVFEGEANDVSAWVSVDHTPGFARTFFGRSIDFYRSRMWRLDGVVLHAVNKPEDASLAFHEDWAFMQLRSDFTQGDTVFVMGSLLVAPADAVLTGRATWSALFTPTPTRSLDAWDWTRRCLLLTVLDQVAGCLEELRWEPAQGVWDRRTVAVPGPGTLSVQTLHDPWETFDPWAEHYWLRYTDFLAPDALMLSRAGSDLRETIKQRQPQFDATGMRVEQAFARSADGTSVPYFIVWPRGAAPGRPAPTLLYGYGGFEVSLQPWYAGSFGVAWFEHGGVLVVANLRGGGEFGPAWHQAAVGAHKQRSYDDFIAVAEDLQRRGICTPAQLAIMGGSNGGLLVSVALTQRPSLFGAVVCQVPLLDMRRYHRLLAGASWMAEYGDPDDPWDWAVIRRYSPYQNLRADTVYPRALFTTSTRDDRVHPGHARKMVARLAELGQPVLYFENMEGGHGGAADNEQRAHLQALEFAYLWGAMGQNGDIFET
jgi:prolyl oligopeptidase